MLTAEIERKAEKLEEVKRREEKRLETEEKKQIQELKEAEARQLRELVVQSLPLFRENDDREAYLEIVEESYLQVNLPRADWAFNLKSKFTRKLLVCWSELCHLTGNDYDVVKVRLLTQKGDTSRKAGLAFFVLTKAEIANWDSNTLVSHNVLMCKRLCGSDNIPL